MSVFDHLELSISSLNILDKADKEHAYVAISNCYFFRNCNYAIEKRIIANL